MYRQAVEAAWGIPAPSNTPADSAQSTHTAAVAEDGQEVSQGACALNILHVHRLCMSSCAEDSADVVIGPQHGFCCYGYAEPACLAVFTALLTFLLKKQCIAIISSS